MSVLVQEALNLISRKVKTKGYEIVPIEESPFRISYKKILATHFMPRFNSSAMDGYGVRINDQNKTVKVIDTILAGSNKKIDITDGFCIKIMTGARVHKSIEAIIPKELVKIQSNGFVKLPSDIHVLSHIRFAQEDIKINECLIDIGETISASTVTLLASQGITHIKVFKKPRITIFASGEELKLHYEKSLEEYQIYNTNTPTLIARVKELGCDTTFIGMAKDSIKSLKKLIANSLDSDLIITSGGVSVGEADFTKEAFDQMGMKTIFDGILIKPGKPTVLGKIDKTIILNLPGNPLASSLIFELFGKIIIQNINGSVNKYHNFIQTTISKELQNKKGKITIIPGNFDGSHFIPSKQRSPGMISILNKCNSMLILDKEVEFLDKNSYIKILPINWLFFTNTQKDFLNYES
ncbi:Molybdopterin biosynthesis protein MoeA [hydrothermal vent metagenome]|uniref:Molybdopterin biosynthesis protein MoeA n=1 Tax=hydrothermal vent metagenome TaxID=652676 RepID=A0A3B1DUK6_9ZZZZ